MAASDPRSATAGLDRWKLAMVLAAAGVMMLAGLAMAVFNDRLYQDSVRLDAVAEADVLAAAAAPSLASGRLDGLRDHVAALAASPKILQAEVLDRRGAPAARYDGPGEAGQGRLEVERPVRLDGVALGRVRMIVRIDPAGQRMLRFGGVGLLAVMAFMLVVVMGAAQTALRRANSELAARAQELQVQMEERARAEAALRQGQKMEAIGRLTGGIAHDFNNLLQAVNGALELIRRRPEDVEKVRRWAEGGLHAVDRGAKLTGQLLAFSRLQRLEFKPLEVVGLLGGLNDLLARTLGPGIDLQFDLEGEGVKVLADATQLELAVLNLAINARDAMPSGGRLTVSSRLAEVAQDPELEAGAYLAVSVADTGAGMTPDVIARAFEPFFTTKGVGQGTGLGLSQVYGIARQAGGTVRIDSTAGVGTVVTLFLRRASGDSAAAAPPPAPAPAVRRAGLILVVDDDPDVRSFLVAALEGLGHQVRSASGGVEALAQLELGRPDLLVVDFAMPGMNGAEVALAARARHAGLPVLVASGFVDVEALRSALPGPAGLLAKPFSEADLAEAVEAELTRAA